MDVRLPDGTVIQNVPDGTTKAELAGKLKANGMSVPDEWLAQDRAKASPADTMGRGEAALVAAGRGTDQIVKGVQQLFYKATGNKSAEDELAQRQAEETALYQPLKEKFPVVTAIGESAPMLTVPIGGAGGAASTIFRSALAGAAPEALRYGSTQERFNRGAVGAAGGAAGAGLGLVAGRLLKPAGASAVGASDDALEAARRVGYAPTAGEKTGNAAMRNFENYLAKSPGSSGRMQVASEANQTALNRAASKAMGETSDDLSEKVFASAKDRIGGDFTRLQQITKPDAGTPEFMNALVKVDSANAARLSYASKKISTEVDKALDLAAQGKITGTAYKEIRTQISSSADEAFSAGDATLGQALKTIRGALDDAAKGSLSSADKKAWDTARKQWQAYKILSKSNVAEAGNISAARLASSVRRDMPNFRSGGVNGELGDIARIGEAFKSVSNPNSGNLTQNMIYGNPITGLPAMIGNKAMGAAYMSPKVQKYMAQGLLDLSPGGQRELIRASGLLALPATQSVLGAQ
jgi:hypothetical protein